MNIQTDTYSSSTIPAGMAYATDALTGKEVLVYMPEMPAHQAPPPPAPAPIVVHVPARSMDVVTSRILAGGAALSGVLVTAAYAAPALHSLEGPAIAVAAAAGAAWLLKGSSPKVNVNVTANITGASATSSSAASSASGWKTTSN